MVFAISINGVLWSVVKRATRRRVNVKCGTVPFSLGGWQSSPVTEVERERERERGRQRYGYRGFLRLSNTNSITKQDREGVLVIGEGRSMEDCSR